MKIIPVIDLAAGQVVHAVRGMREHYQPIQRFSQLTASSEPKQVIADFLRVYPFDCFYIADLDAIRGTGDHSYLIAELLKLHPGIEFWVDDGSQLAELQSDRPNRKTVIGTESQRATPYRVYQDYVLSLDFNRQALGNAAWFNDPHYWPDRVILMTLTRVGSNLGPDTEKLQQFLSAHPAKNLIAAGGIRNYSDLNELAQLGISGALIATALHSGSIGGTEITELRAKKYPGKPGYS